VRQRPGNNSLRREFLPFLAATTFDLSPMFSRPDPDHLLHHAGASSR
jgi:hypothetical protein